LAGNQNEGGRIAAMAIPMASDFSDQVMDFSSASIRSWIGNFFLHLPNSRPKKTRKYPLVNVYITMENHHFYPFLMGKLTINGHFQ
jgi:hypothetical protein